MRMVLLLTCLSLQGFSAEPSFIKHLTPVTIQEKTSGLSGIDCLYVINLKERQDKWIRMQEILGQRGLRGNRVEGVNGWGLSDETVKRLTENPYRIGLKKGQVGCFLAHLSVWKDALERGFDVVWVLEDDVAMGNVEALPGLLSELSKKDPEWDVLFTDHPGHSFGVYPIHQAFVTNPREVNKKIPITKDIVRIFGRWGTYSMVLSRSGLSKLWNQVERLGIFGPVDYQLHLHKDLHCYSLLYPLVTHAEIGVSNTKGSP